MGLYKKVNKTRATEQIGSVEIMGQDGRGERRKGGKRRKMYSSIKMIKKKPMFLNKAQVTSI